jgi:hypothetical protein
MSDQRIAQVYIYTKKKDGGGYNKSIICNNWRDIAGYSIVEYKSNETPTEDPKYKTISELNQKAMSEGYTHLRIAYNPPTRIVTAKN